MSGAVADFALLSEVHGLAVKSMVGWGMRFVEADGGWEFWVTSVAPVEDWHYEGSFELGIRALLRHLRGLQP